MARKKAVMKAGAPERVPITVDHLDLSHARWACLAVDVHVGHLVEMTRERRGIDERLQVVIDSVEAAVEEMWTKMQEVSRTLR